MLFWSLACASHGLATSIGMLAASRLLLGMGEGGGFPAATRAVAEWFPGARAIDGDGHHQRRDRGRRRRGAAADRAGGHDVGLAYGVLPHRRDRRGLVGVVVARRTTRPSGTRGSAPKSASCWPRSSRRAAARGAPPRWRTLLQVRQTWGLVTAKFLSDAAWYFYLFWLPKYLYDARGFDIKAVGAFAWIPYAAAGIGCLAGGWLSSRLLVGNVPLNRARKIALGLSAAVMPAVLLIPSVPVGWALAIFSLAYFGQQSWSTLVMILPTDMYPRSAIGAVAGWSASAARWVAWCSGRSSARCWIAASATASCSRSPARSTCSRSSSCA